MFGEAPAVEAVEVMRAMLKSGAHTNFRPGEEADAFQSGNLGMVLTTSVYQRSFLSAAKDKFELRAAAMPHSATNRQSRPLGSALFIMSRTRSSSAPPGKS